MASGTRTPIWSSVRSRGRVPAPEHREDRPAPGEMAGAIPAALLLRLRRVAERGRVVAYFRCEVVRLWAAHQEAARVWRV